MGFTTFAHSPPLEQTEPMDDSHRFKHRRLQSDEPSSRPSTSSGAREVSREGSRERPAETRRKVTVLQLEEAAFILEEIGTESEYNSETEILRPDVTEDECSEKAAEERQEADAHIIGPFQALHCRDNSDSEDERKRRYIEKRKRWSAGMLKRSHSKSVGSDSDMDDAEALDAHDVGVSARRLRRRVRGPGDRTSLIFEDITDNHIVEVDEDDGCNAESPPSLPSDTEEFSPRDFPFWVLKDPMEIDSLSSRPSSTA
jgi:hypothetical protein